MQVDALAVHLRPRPMAEAADLGLLLVHRHAASLLRSWLPLYLAFVALALATIEIRPWLPTLLIFWGKPWLDRTLLFVLSRAVFGQSTGWSDLWAQRAAVWGRGWLPALTRARLSPWRSFIQPVAQLEGQRARAGRQRSRQLLKGKRGSAFGMHFVFAHAEFALCVGLLALGLWFAPPGTHWKFLVWLRDGGTLGSGLALAGVYALVVALLEPFYVASGFAMYLNRRVELEAWDIEQEFRRAFA